MKSLKRVFKGFLFLLLAGLLTGATALPLSAQVSIPEGSIISNAVLSVYWYSYWPTTFYIQRITSGWNEATVTWNTRPSYDPYVWGSFTTPAGGAGWYTVNVTALVQGWAGGSYPNYGISLRQEFPGVERWNNFHSSEYALDVSLRPKLEIWFTAPNGSPGYVVIQRPEPAEPTVFDASVMELYPTTNYNRESLTTAHVPTETKLYEKYSLLQFHFTVVPSMEGCTPGYWRNSLGAWGPTGYEPNANFDATFGINKFGSTYTLLNAIWQGGGGWNKVARHATAALLSAAHPEVNYPYSVAEVISVVQQIWATGDTSLIDPFANANELGCYIPNMR